MKKKIIALTLASFLVGGGLTYAATNYYADLVLSQEQQLKDLLLEQYETREKEIGQQVHHDMVMYASTQRDALLERMEQYLKDKLDGEQQDRMNMHAEEINKAIESLEVELTEYIDGITAE